MLSKDNRQRLLKLAVAIVTNELNDDEKLTEAWFEVYDQVISQVDLPYVQLVAINVIEELTDRKSSF